MFQAVVELKWPALQKISVRHGTLEDIHVQFLVAAEFPLLESISFFSVGDFPGFGERDDTDYRRIIIVLAQGKWPTLRQVHFPWVTSLTSTLICSLCCSQVVNAQRASWAGHCEKWSQSTGELHSPVSWLPCQRGVALLWTSAAPGPDAEGLGNFYMLIVEVTSWRHAMDIQVQLDCVKALSAASHYVTCATSHQLAQHCNTSCIDARQRTKGIVHVILRLPAAWIQIGAEGSVIMTDHSNMYLSLFIQLLGTA